MEPKAREDDSLILESFVRDARKALEVFETQCQNEKLETDEGIRRFIITVHGMKSSLGNIGESALSTAANQLEIAGKSRNIGFVTDKLLDFTKALRELSERLAPIRDEHGVDDDIEGLLIKLRAITELCDDFDREGVLDVITEVKRYSKETGEVFEKLKELVLHSDFDEAAAMAEDYAARLRKLV